MVASETGRECATIHAREISCPDPMDAAEKLATLPHLAFLDSAMPDGKLGRFSYLAAGPFLTVQTHPDALRAALRQYPCETAPGLPPFQGGAIGYFSYELGLTLERVAIPGTDVRPPGNDLAFHFYDVVLAYDHMMGRAWLMASGWPEADAARRHRRAERRLDQFEALLAAPTPETCFRERTPLHWASSFTRAQYCEAVSRVRDYIAAGDIYQANISQRFSANLTPDFDPWAFYRVLRRLNPAPFAAWLSFDDRSIASSSPERFLQFRNGIVEARPIKGTAKRLADPAADARAAEDLRNSEKDVAENVMIVDLMRNDLSRICEPGSVQVPTLCGLESYASVHHLVSVVTGRTVSETDALDVVAATFPGGSITGAPKIRAMEIISEIENTPRDVYCGSIGYIGFDGTMDLNIAIRTVSFSHDRAVFSAGGGVTLLSDPEAEYQETLTKAARIFDAFTQAALAS